MFDIVSAKEFELFEAHLLIESFETLNFSMLLLLLFAHYDPCLLVGFIAKSPIYYFKEKFLLSSALEGRIECT